MVTVGGLLTYLSSGEISVYVHIPFCSRRCIYCDFASTTKTELMKEYFESVGKEIDMSSGQLEGKQTVTLYFGGGTPSHVSVKYIENIVETLASHLFFDVKEATLEFNPEDVNRKLCHELLEVGINRVSVGLQTSSDELLKVLGRPYTFEQFKRAYSILKENFDNVNVDFMYSLPFERLSDVEKDLKAIEELEPVHVSFYELEIHEDVPLFSMVKSGQVQLPSEDVSEKMYDSIAKSLEEMGYSRYELSSWTKGKPCVHNVRYWKNENYIGFGLSAGSHLSNKRWVNTGEIHDYISKIRVGEYPRIYESQNSKFDEVSETLFMGLRLAEGVNVKEMRDRFGDSFDEAFSRIK